MPSMRMRAVVLALLSGCSSESSTAEPPQDVGVETSADVSDAIIDAPKVDPVDIGLGRAHTCAKMSDATVRCWGWNKVSQLGDQTRDSRTRPVVAFGVVDAVALSVGGNHACVLTSAKKLTCWGGNAAGQVGDPSEVLWTLKPTTKILPAAVLASQIALGGAHTCARVTDGTLSCWGSGRYGQIGYLGTSNCTTFTLGDTPCNVKPAPVPDMTDIAEVALGDGHTCIRRNDGSVACWGRNSSGQLGGGASVPLEEIGPRVEVKGLGKVAKLALGGEHTCALLEDGTVQCWGKDDEGQLGDGGSKIALDPQTVPGLTDVVDLSLGSAHTCARVKDGTVRCFGNNDFGQLGDGTKDRRRTPTAIGALAGAKKVALGSTHSCALFEDASVRCFGNNGDGQLGDGTNDPRLVPTPVVW